ncbi:MAG: DUF4268 domain-containing protein [Draconibacterium sp.]
MYSKEEIKKLHLDFWELFRKRCEVHPELQHKKKKFMLHRTKIRGVAFRFEANRNNAKVMLEIHHRSEDTRLKAFEIIERYKVIMEEGFENGLTWEFYHQREDSGQEVCRIFTTLENVDIHRQNQWPDIYNFFIENMLRLEENFAQISDIVREELQG